MDAIHWIKNEQKWIFYSSSEHSPACEIRAAAPIFGSCRNKTFHIHSCCWNNLTTDFDKIVPKVYKKAQNAYESTCTWWYFSSSFRNEFSFDRIWQKMSWWARFFRILCRHSVTTTIYGHVPCWQLHSVKSPSQRWICCPVIGEYTFFESAITIILQLIQC